MYISYLYEDKYLVVLANFFQKHIAKSDLLNGYP